MTWRVIPGFERYEVSDAGDIRNASTGRVLQLAVALRGYLRVNLGTPNGPRMMLAHRAVLLAFVGPCPEGMVACHGNGVSSDNRVENLRWGTQSENNRDAVRHGTHAMTARTHCPHGHPYDDENTFVAATGKRYCRTCIRARRARREQRRLAEAPRATCPACGKSMPAITRRGPRQVCSKACSGAFRNATSTPIERKSA